MEQKEFEEKMVELLREKYDEAAEISVKEILKYNGTRLRGIVVSMEGERFTPILYMEGAYKRYQECKDIEKVLEEMLDANDAQIREMETNWDLQPEQFEDYRNVKGHLRSLLINQEKNEELLKDMPHIRWNDLAVIFYYDIKDGEARVPINSRHLALWGKTAKDLYDDAMDNMRCGETDKMFPLSRLFGVSEEPAIHVLTNSSRRYGAAAMLYSPKIRELADNIDSDLVILPSSVHEVLLVPDDDEKRKRFRELVGKVNRAVLEPEEVLSDNIYHYSRERDTVELLPAG